MRGSNGFPTACRLLFLLTVLQQCNGFVRHPEVQPFQKNLPSTNNFVVMDHHGLCKRENPWRYKRTRHDNPFPASFQESSFALRMALVPLSVEDLDLLLNVSGAPTGEQTASYWGRTQRERYGRIFESSVVTILGLIFSYFLSFVLGGFVATILGSIFLYWSVLSPQLQAYQRNWELRGGRELVDPWVAEESLQISEYDFDYDDEDEYEAGNRMGLYGALFLGHIEDVCVVEEASAPSSEEFDLIDFQDYKMEEDELEKWTGNPYLLRVRAVDDEDRKLQVHARMSEEYLDLSPGQPILGLMLSTTPGFTKLAALTELFVPDLDCWIGDYPYLDRAATEQLLASDDEMWELLQDQRAEDDVVVDPEED